MGDRDSDSHLLIRKDTHHQAGLNMSTSMGRSRVHENKLKGLKVAKEDQRSIGSMVDRLDGR